MDSLTACVALSFMVEHKKIITISALQPPCYKAATLFLFFENTESEGRDV